MSNRDVRQPAGKISKPRRTMAEKLDALNKMERKAREAAELPPAERRKLIALRKSVLAHARRDLAERTPSAEALESDLFELLVLVGAEFITRYYPDSSGSIVLSQNVPRGETGYAVAIPLIAPARNPEAAR